jgi:hypothetical protein
MYIENDVLYWIFLNCLHQVGIGRGVEDDTARDRDCICRQGKVNDMDRPGMVITIFSAASPL